MNNKNINNKQNKTIKTIKEGRNDKIYFTLGRQKLKNKLYIYIISIFIYLFINIKACANSGKILYFLGYETFRFYSELKIIVDALIILVLLVFRIGIITLLGRIGRPIDAKEIENTLEENNFVTSKTKQSPLLLLKRKDKTKEDSIEYEFYNRGISIDKWKFTDFENWLDGYITYLDYSKHMLMSIQKCTIFQIY